LGEAMWDILDYIVKYLVEQGGIWGLFVAIALIWIGYREWSLLKKKKNESEVVNKKPDEDSNIIKERQEDQIRFMEQNSEKLTDVSQKLQDISLHIDNFVSINENNNEKIEKLTLQKIKFVLKTKLGED
jgi:hypothetical protein